MTTKPIAFLSASLGCSVLLFGACTSGGGRGGSGSAGELASKPSSGAPFFVDENKGGSASQIKLVEAFWGRLVDVHDIGPGGEVSSVPVLRDLVVNENLQSDGADYVLETNPITLKTRLIIQRQLDAPNTGRGTFRSLLKEATRGLPPINAKNDDGTSAPPFSFVARNGCVSLRFSDCLDDSEEAAANLNETVKLLTGYRPALPYATRILFDPNHGAIAGTKFHSTRVLIDMTVSNAEAEGLPASVSVNTIGLPASLFGREDPNVSIRIPTELDTSVGQFHLLQGHNGARVVPTGPMDRGASTLDIVRAFRSGNTLDANNGFLLDLSPPRVVGQWPATLSRVTPDPSGAIGFDFLFDVEFATVCQAPLRVGDTFSIGSSFLEVTETSAAPRDSKLTDVKARLLSSDPVPPASLVGAGFHLSTFDPASTVHPGCWITFAPLARTVPATGVSKNAQAIVRFSEPMDPDSVTPFDSFMMIRGVSGGEQIEAESIVVGTIGATLDLKEFSYTSILSLAHQQGNQEPYHLRFGDLTDLAGNSLVDALPSVDFTLAADEPSGLNSSVVLRFSDLDEVKPKDVFLNSLDDIRGQIFYDFDRGVIKPRDVSFTSYVADRSNPVPAIMIPFPRGIQTPLSPLGSRLMTVWRYCDLGWSASDETKYNVDVYGIHWSPIGGRVNRDIFDEFEIRLSHSRFLPDEDIDGNLLPKYPNSGLRTGTRFANNVLNDPFAGEKTVHSRELGYLVDPADLSVSPTGTPLMPYPLNRTGGSKLSTYTWRDTAGVSTSGPSGRGVPLDIETNSPLNLVPGSPGDLWSVSNIPTAGLPLLMEFRCYPANSGVGLNPLDISLAINSSAVPNFRVFSTGGINTDGNPVTVNPDTEQSPSGGFNPTSRPPGRRTARSGDNSFYIGQLDIVTKISRAHTVWIDTLIASPTYLDPIAIPQPTRQPLGTQAIIEFRGATSFADSVGVRKFDSSFINAYGNVQNLNKPPIELPVTYFPNSRWQSSISSIDGASFFQMRITFVNDIDSGLSPELSAIGTAFF